VGAGYKTDGWGTYLGNEEDDDDVVVVVVVSPSHSPIRVGFVAAADAAAIAAV
jgi:hypothetical protein